MHGQLATDEDERKDEAILASRLAIPHTINGSCGVKLNFPDLLGAMEGGAAAGALPGSRRRFSESTLIYVPPLRIASLPDSQVSELPAWLKVDRPAEESRPTGVGVATAQSPSPPPPEDGGGCRREAVWTYLEESSAQGGPSSDASAKDASSSSWDRASNVNNNAKDTPARRPKAKAPSKSGSGIIPPAPPPPPPPQQQQQQQQVPQPPPSPPRGHAPPASAASSAAETPSAAHVRMPTSPPRSPLSPVALAPRQPHSPTAAAAAAHDTEPSRSPGPGHAAAREPDPEPEPATVAGGEPPITPAYVTTIRVERSSTVKEFFGPGEVIGIEHFGTFDSTEDCERWMSDPSYRPPPARKEGRP